MGRPKGSINGVRKDDPDKQIIEFPHIGDSITLERVLKAKRCTLYKYTKIEYEGEKPIEIVEYFDKNKYYVDKVILHYSEGYPVYRKIRIVRDSINRLINFEYNKPVIIIGTAYNGKKYKVTIYTESRNILLRNKGGCTLKYMMDEPYIFGTHYIISYNDTLDQERRFFNDFK